MEAPVERHLDLADGRHRDDESLATGRAGRRPGHPSRRPRGSRPRRAPRPAPSKLPVPGLEAMIGRADLVGPQRGEDRAPAVDRRRGAARRTCRRSRPRSRRRRRGRRSRRAAPRGPRRRRRGPRPRWAAAAIRAIGLIVPTAFDAQPTATSRVRGAEELLEAGEVERAVVEVRLPPADDEAAVGGDRQPRIDVRGVVEAGQDDLVAGLQAGADRAAEVEGQGRHVRRRRRSRRPRPRAGRPGRRGRPRRSRRSGATSRRPRRGSRSRSGSSRRRRR